MYFKWLLIIAIFWLGSCASLDDAGRAYFRQGNKVKGVEPAPLLVERMRKEQKLREIMYGQAKAEKLIQCTLLRNQLYVASMKKTTKELEEVTRLMETAYQESDDAFLTTCEQIIATKIGRLFIAIQHQYLIQER